MLQLGWIRQFAKLRILSALSSRFTFSKSADLPEPEPIVELAPKAPFSPRKLMEAMISLTAGLLAFTIFMGSATSKDARMDSRSATSAMLVCEVMPESPRPQIEWQPLPVEEKSIEVQPTLLAMVDAKDDLAKPRKWNMDSEVKPAKKQDPDDAPLNKLPSIKQGNKRSDEDDFPLPKTPVLPKSIKGTPLKVGFIKPANIRISKTPALSKLGDQLLLIAKVTDEDGKPLSDAAVEWNVDRRGTGKISKVTVPKQSGKPSELIRLALARTYTSSQSYELNWSRDLTQEVKIGPGETWCVLEADEVGDMIVSANAVSTEIADRMINGQVQPYATARAETHWYVAVAEFPQNQKALSGTEALLKTRITDVRTRLPLAGYRVRYRLATNGSGSFASGNRAVEIITDVQGRASTSIRNLDYSSESTRGLIEVLGRSNFGDSKETVIAKSEFQVDWTLPQLRLTVDAPKKVKIGETAKVIATVRNEDRGIAKFLKLTAFSVKGAEFVDHNGESTLVLDELAPGDSKSWELAVKSTSLQSANCSVELKDRAQTRDVQKFQVAFVAPKIKIEKFYPREWRVGQVATWNVIVCNEGDATANDVQIVDEVPEGIEVTNTRAKQLPGKLVWIISRIEPGEKIRLTAEGSPHSPIELAQTTTTIQGEGGASGETLKTKLVVEGIPAINVDLSQTKNPIEEGQELEYVVVIKNLGNGTATDIMVEADLNSHLQPLNITGALNGKVEQDAIKFDVIKLLEPGNSKECRISAKAIKSGDGRISIRIRHPSLGDSGLVQQESSIIYSQKK